MYQNIRNLDRQGLKPESINEEDIERVILDFQSGSELLQLHSLKKMVNILETDQNEIFVKKYGENLLEFFLDMSQYGLLDEIQSLSLKCVALCYKHQILEVTAISRPQYIQFLIGSKLTQSIPESNAALSILSVVALEEEKTVGIIINQGILNIIPQLPPETGFGELVDALLQQLSIITPAINDIISLLPMMLSSPNPSNVAHGLKCVDIFISRNWDCFNFDEFHSTFPQFLLSEDPSITSTAFTILKKFPPNEYDIQAVYQALSRGGNNSIYPVEYFHATQQLWMENPSPELFNCFVLCISKSKYNVVNRALPLLLYSLKAANLQFNSENVGILSSFLGDKNAAKYIIPALCYIWDKIQVSNDTRWFSEEIAQYDAEIDEMTSDPDGTVAELASKLLQIMA